MQVWSIDITYIPMEKGFMYLTAIIDVYSRAIMACGLHNTLDGANSIEVLDEAVNYMVHRRLSTPIRNARILPKTGQRPVRDIKSPCRWMGRARDNIWIERFWRTLKTEYIYLNPAPNVPELREGIFGFIKYYNHRRHHQSLDGRVPWQVFLAAA